MCVVVEWRGAGVGGMDEAFVLNERLRALEKLLLIELEHQDISLEWTLCFSCPLTKSLMSLLSWDVSVGWHRGVRMKPK